MTMQIASLNCHHKWGIPGRKKRFPKIKIKWDSLTTAKCKNINIEFHISFLNMIWFTVDNTQNGQNCLHKIWFIQRHYGQVTLGCNARYLIVQPSPWMQKNCSVFIFILDLKHTSIQLARFNYNISKKNL